MATPRTARPTRGLWTCKLSLTAADANGSGSAPSISPPPNDNIYFHRNTALNRVTIDIGKTIPFDNDDTDGSGAVLTPSLNLRVNQTIPNDLHQILKSQYSLTPIVTRATHSRSPIARAARGCFERSARSRRRRLETLAKSK
jgi:hypothetical protein